MREIIKKYNVYKFEELTEDQQEKAIEKLYDINVDHDWWCSTFEDAERVGIKMTSFELDHNRHAEGKLLKSPQDVIAEIIKEHGESCETYKTAMEFKPKFEEILAKDENEQEDEYQELQGEFEKSILEDYSILLQNEYEYQTSREAIIETINVNEYEFTEEGRLA